MIIGVLVRHFIDRIFGLNTNKLFSKLRVEYNNLYRTVFNFK